MTEPCPGTVLWDFDGTLVSRPHMWARSCLSALAEWAPGHRITLDVLVTATSHGFPWHAPQLSYEHITHPPAWWAHIARRFQEVLCELGVPGDPDQITDRIRKDILDASQYSLRDDVMPALERVASNGWRQIIVSNHVPELHEIICGLGLRTFFTQVLSSASVGFEKPHPELFRRALQLSVPGRPVYMIGDSATSDCLPARELGIRAILVRTSCSEYEPHTEGLAQAVTMLLDGTRPLHS